MAAVLVGGATDHVFAQPSWEPARAVQPGYGAAMSYDSVRGRAVMFGSTLGIASTWEWDGTDWLLRSPAHVPPAGAGALAYDLQRARTVLFIAGSTWEWDGNDWLALTPASSPSAREGHAMAYDRARGKVVMFGGQVNYVNVGDTWEWDGAIWLQRGTVNSPAPRYRHALAYDVARARTVLFGGHAQTPFADTWEWDGSQWTARSSAVSPPVTSAHGMVYDELRGRTLVFGGIGSTGNPLQDTWEWDGTVWNQRTPRTSPAVRAFPAMAYDRRRGRVVVHAGTGLFAMYGLDDTWEWDGNDWAQRRHGFSTSVQPSGMAFDLARGRLVMVAVSNPMQTFEMEGWRWVLRKTDPTPGMMGPIVYDAARQCCVMVTAPGYPPANETWEWNGERWSQRVATGGPPPRSNHALAYDLAHGRTVLFGGQTSGATSPALGDTWAWDGKAWTQLYPPTSPPARWGHTLAYDTLRGRVVLHGGSSGAPAPPSLLTDTWEWDGTTWLQHNTAQQPPARVGAGMTYDWVRARTVMFGGIDYSFGSFADTWEWDGSAWTQVLTATAPAKRIVPVLAYDLRRQLVVLTGGSYGPMSAVQDTWTYGPSRCAVTPFGSACQGTNGLPVLTAGTPFLGNGAFTLDVLSAAPAATCWFALAAAAQSVSLGGGCTLLVAQPTVLLAAATNAGGYASARVALPDDPRLVGGSAFAQAFVLDPAGAYRGLALSGGLRLTLGH